MELQDYKPNSHNYRERNGGVAEGHSMPVSEDQKKKEKVTTGTVATKKSSVVKKVGGDLFAGDASKIKDYLIHDIAIPAFKKWMFESIMAGAEMSIFGETRRSEGRSSDGRRAYNKIYDERNSRSTGPSRVATRNGSYDYDEVIFNSRADAEMVLDEMDRDIEKFGMVSVLDMYDHAGVDSVKHTDCKYGWTNLRTADVGRNGDGTFYLKLPRARELDN